MTNLKKKLHFLLFIFLGLSIGSPLEANDQSHENNIPSGQGAELSQTQERELEKLFFKKMLEPAFLETLYAEIDLSNRNFHKRPLPNESDLKKYASHRVKRLRIAMREGNRFLEDMYLGLLYDGRLGHYWTSLFDQKIITKKDLDTLQDALERRRENFRAVYQKIRTFIERPIEVLRRDDEEAKGENEEVSLDELVNTVTQYISDMEEIHRTLFEGLTDEELAAYHSCSPKYFPENFDIDVGQNDELFGEELIKYGIDLGRGDIMRHPLNEIGYIIQDYFREPEKVADLQTLYRKSIDLLEKGEGLDAKDKARLMILSLMAKTRKLPFPLSKPLYDLASLQRRVERIPTVLSGIASLQRSLEDEAKYYLEENSDPRAASMVLDAFEALNFCAHENLPPRNRWMYDKALLDFQKRRARDYLNVNDQTGALSLSDQNLEAIQSLSSEAQLRVLIEAKGQLPQPIKEEIFLRSAEKAANTIRLLTMPFVFEGGLQYIRRFVWPNANWPTSFQSAILGQAHEILESNVFELLREDMIHRNLDSATGVPGTPRKKPKWWKEFNDLEKRNHTPSNWSSYIERAYQGSFDLRFAPESVDDQGQEMGHRLRIEYEDDETGGFKATFLYLKNDEMQLEGFNTWPPKTAP